MNKHISAERYVLNRKIPITLSGNVSSIRSIQEFQERKQVEVRRQIGDLLALGIPYELRDNYGVQGDFVEVHVPSDVEELKEFSQKLLKENGFSGWQKSQGKAEIVQRLFGLIPHAQRFAVYDRETMRALLDRVTFKITEGNRAFIAQEFFPEEPLPTVRGNIKFAYDSHALDFAELVVENGKRLLSEIVIDGVIFPLHAVESNYGNARHQLSFVELTKRMQNVESA